MEKKPKIYKVVTTKNYCRTERQPSVFQKEGTLEELTQCFSYTLEVGASWNKKINRNPKTIAALVKNLQASYEEKEAACYDRTSVTLLK
jgi:hypothetical protein